MDLRDKNVLVMMSTYNGELYITDQIHSIMNQKSNCRIVLRIRDDGSKDKTCEIIKKLQIDYGDRIELVEGQNLGYNGSFFELIKTAEGYDYYAFSDQDDVWMEEKVQTAVEWMEKESLVYNGPVLYASTSYLVEDDLIPYGTTRKQQRKFTLYNTIVQNICPGHNQFMNEKLVEIVKSKIANAEVYVYDSWVTNLAMLFGRILFNNDPQTYYRQHNLNQLGAGAGSMKQLMTSIKHSKAGHGLKYRRQIESFVELNKDDMDKTELKELLYFINSKTFFTRFLFAIRTKLHRQKRIESIAFRCAIIFGSF